MATAATAASINPAAIAIGPDGSIYIADSGYNRVRRISPEGIITTVAGTGEWRYTWDGGGYSGDGGPATEARLNSPRAVAVGPDGSIYIGDIGNSRLRRVDPQGIITTVAGTGQSGYNGDGGPAASAMLAWPICAVGPDGAIYIAEANNHRIRRIRPALQDFTSDEYAIPSEDGSQIYHFDTNGRHLATINALTGTKIHTFHYDERGLLVRIEDADGNVTTIERDASGHPAAIVATFGQRTVLSVNADGYLESVINPVGETVRLSHTPDGLLNELVDPRGGVHRFTYDFLGRLVRDEDPAGGVTTLEREDLENGYVVTKKEKVDEVTELITSYKVEHLPAGGTRMTNTGCCGGPIVSVVSPDGTTAITHPDGTVTVTVYGPDPRFGMQAPITKSMTIQTPGGLTYTQTAEREVILATPGDPLSLQTLTDTVTINGRIYTSVYDAATRKITSTTPEGRRSFTTLDEKGRVVLVETPGLAPVGFTYDARGRLAVITEGTGAEARTTAIAYNAQGYIDSITDPLNRTTSFEYDAAGRVVTEILPDGRRIPYTYDPHGNVTSITPPGRPAHTFTYTPVDLEETHNQPPVAGGGTNQTSYAYDLNRQPTLVARPDGQTIGFEYDAMGRLVTLTIPSGEIAYVYDAVSGNLTDIIAPDGGTLGYGYDGSLHTEATWAGTIAGSVGYGYDNDFRLTSLKVNDADPVAYQYDQDGFLIQAGDLTMARGAQNGMLTGTTLGNVTDMYTYNAFGEVTDYAAKYNGSDLYRVHQELDKLGRITSKTETVLGETHTYDYGYDQAGRLVDVHKDGVLISHYEYDNNGNRLAHTTPEGTVTGTYDDQDRLLAYGDAIYEYTANGELIRKTDASGTTRYDYDVLGNLTSVTLPDGTRIDYIIDGQNRRIGKKVNGVLVQGFLYQDILEPVVEFDGIGNIVARFIYGSRGHVPDYMVKDGVSYRIICDYSGSIRLVVDLATSQVAQWIEYDEFGNVILDTNPGFQPFGFAGGIYDRDTKLVRFGARDYIPEVGRYSVIDPIKDGLNWYVYCRNNPICFIDPYGESITIPWPLRPEIAITLPTATGILSTIGSAIGSAVAVVTLPIGIIFGIDLFPQKLHRKQKCVHYHIQIQTGLHQEDKYLENILQEKLQKMQQIEWDVK